MMPLDSVGVEVTVLSARYCQRRTRRGVAEDLAATEPELSRSWRYDDQSDAPMQQRVSADATSASAADRYRRATISRSLFARRRCVAPAANCECMPGRLHIGCMGWQEKDWIGPVYPAETKAPDMLALYARRFSTVEVDSTFYGRPRESTVVAWKDAAPDGFRFALKVSREITHKKHFEDAGQSFTWFVDRARLLGPALGALLLQCGGDFRPTPANKTRLYTFLDEHLPPDVNMVLELRHRDWFDDSLFEAARSQRFAIAATEGPHSTLELAKRILEEQGSELGFAYARLMGLTAF